LTAETGPAASLTVNVGEVYEHFKGGRYRVLAIARSQTDNPDDHVVYQSLSDGSVWVRPVPEWSRPVRWDDGETRPRFRPASAAPGDIGANVDAAGGPCAVSVP
jgi:hypothetical protein